MRRLPNKSRACVKSADTKFGNDHIFDMANFGESSRWLEWLQNEFSHSLSLHPTAAALATSERMRLLMAASLRSTVTPGGCG
jgi:hypothetical protein